MAELEVTRLIGWYICPTFVNVKWWQWPIAVWAITRVLLGQLLLYPELLQSLRAHKPCGAKECYRLVVGWNGRERFKWKAHS